MRAARPCLERGCPTLVRNAIRCATHQQTHVARHAAADLLRRGSARERGYDTAWEKVREIHLAEHPICQDCEAEGRTNATDLDVDHVVPFNGKADPLRLDASNL